MKLKRLFLAFLGSLLMAGMLTSPQATHAQNSLPPGIPAATKGKKPPPKSGQKSQTQPGQKGQQKKHGFGRGISALNRVKQHLSQSQNAYGGHVARAIQLIDAAIRELQEATKMAQQDK